MKKILLIATGGTIASGNTPSGLTPTISGEELLKSVPGLKNICEPHAIQVLNLDSTDMTPADWLVISGAIERYYDEYDGFVVAHGTDTMAYTAAALSYLVRRSPKPIVLTGAQKPIHSENTDSQVNLLDAFAYACSPGSCGVVIGNATTQYFLKALPTRSQVAGSMIWSIFGNAGAGLVGMAAASGLMKLAQHLAGNAQDGFLLYRIYFLLALAFCAIVCLYPIFRLKKFGGAQ